jgi:hypothetical protein
VLSTCSNGTLPRSNVMKMWTVSGRFFLIENLRCAKFVRSNLFDSRSFLHVQMRFRSHHRDTRPSTHLRRAWHGTRQLFRCRLFGFRSTATTCVRDYPTPTCYCHVLSIEWVHHNGIRAAMRAGWVFRRHKWGRFWRNRAINSLIVFF